MRILSLTYRNLREIYRDPVSVLLGLVLPVTMLLLFSSIEKNIKLDIFKPQQLTPAIIIFSYAFLVMFCAILLAKDRQNAFLTRLLTTPLQPGDFIISYMLPFIPLIIFQAVVCFIIGLAMGAVFQQVFLLSIVLFLAGSICVSIGTILGSLLTINQVSGVGSILVTAIGLFGGGWLDLKAVGGVFEIVGYLLPFAHAVDVTRALASGEPFGTVLYGFYWVLLYALFLFILAILAFRTRTRPR